MKIRTLYLYCAVNFFFLNSNARVLHDLRQCTLDEHAPIRSTVNNLNEWIILKLLQKTSAPKEKHQSSILSNSASCVLVVSIKLKGIYYFLKIWLALTLELNDSYFISVKAHVMASMIGLIFELWMDLPDKDANLQNLQNSTV